MNITLPKPVFATAPAARLTDRYGFIPTNELVAAFEREDWVVTEASTKRVRNAEPKNPRRRSRIRWVTLRTTKKAKTMMEEEMGQITGGIKVPGLF